MLHGLRNEMRPANAEREIMKIEVTLTNSKNTYLQYPCVGLLHVIEMGTHNKIIVAVFHRKEGDGKYGAPVSVDHPQFIYA